MSFLFPSYLFGLTLIAIPIIIHFFNFQRAKKVYFTNVQFLRTVKEVTNARNKIKNILVLLSRILFVIFLIMAFARPFIPNKNAGAFGNSNYVNIYLDNSYSMQNENDNRRLFDIALRQTEQVSQLFPSNTLFQLLDNSFSGGSNFYYDAEKLNEKLSELDFSNTGRLLSDILGKQLTSFQQNSFGNSNHIFWLSDFQRNSIGSLSQIELDTTNSYYLIPLRPNSETNLFIDSVWLTNPFVKLEESNILNLRIQNEGNESIDEKVVKLFIDDKQVSSSTVSIDEKSSEILNLNFAITDAGDKKCKLVIDDFPVLFDNEFYFILKVAPKIKIVSVVASENSFVSEVYANETFFDLQKMNINAPDYTLLNNADLVILENIAEIDNALLNSLKKANQKGTSIALFPSANLNIESYKQLLQIPLNVQQTVQNASAFVGMTSPDDKNPFFEGVFDKVIPNMSMPKGIQFLDWGRLGQHLITFKNDAPFLSLFENTNYKVFIFSSPLSDRWTDFPKHALFVPTMYKIALTSKTTTDQLAFSFKESIANIEFDSISKNDIIQLRGTESEIIPSQRIVGSELLMNIPKTGISAGTYDMIKAKDETLMGYIAFNYDNVESNLDYYNPEELKDFANSHPNVQLFENVDEDNFAQEFRENNVSKPLWRYAILIALFFLLVESVLVRFWKTEV